MSEPNSVTEQDIASRQLPDEQVQINEMDDEQEAAIQSMEAAQELAAQFEEIQTATQNDGTLKVPLKSIDTSKGNQAIAISVDVPAEDSVETFYMNKPKIWTERYEFVRWVQQYGYGASDFHRMIEAGVSVEVEQDNGEYQIVIPDYTPDSYWVRINEAIRQYAPTAEEESPIVVWGAVIWYFTSLLFASIFGRVGVFGPGWTGAWLDTFFTMILSLMLLAAGAVLVEAE